MVLTLYKLDASPPVRAVLMTIEALQIPDVQYQEIDLLQAEHLKEEYVKINPQHTIPTLKDDDFIIWDSHAIAGYLVGKYGDNDSLYPTDYAKRAVVDQRLHFDSGILFPVLRSTVGPIIFKGETSFRPENLELIKEGYDLAEKFLTSTWIAGDNITIADICCAATISTLNIALPIDGDTFPNLATWLNRISKQEFYIKGNVPGMEKLGAMLKEKLS